MRKQSLNSRKEAKILRKKKSWVMTKLDGLHLLSSDGVATVRTDKVDDVLFTCCVVFVVLDQVGDGVEQVFLCQVKLFG